MVTVRPADINDLDGIMEVEKETFGSFSVNAMAGEMMMASRIGKLNSAFNKWFWVAEERGVIVGDIILQPTDMMPHELLSWNRATDNGTLASTFDPRGRNIYVVSLAANDSGPVVTSALLAHAGFVMWLKSRKELFMFCSRMPGYHKAFQRSGISPQAYWQLKRPDGSPKDWMLHLYWEMTGGAQPVRLLKDGFLVDKESGGHGVLFAADDPARALLAIAERICEAAATDTKRGGQS